MAKKKKGTKSAGGIAWKDKRIKRRADPVDPESPAGVVAAALGDKDGREVDPSKLDHKKATSRLGAIYDLERNVERCRILYEIAKRDRKSAKERFELAEEALEAEIREQRIGPGPLYAGVGAQGNEAREEVAAEAAADVGNDDDGE